MPERIDSLAMHPDPEVRARVAGIYGRRAGGKDRQRDVQGALRLLKDREPMVRWAAVTALHTIYASGALEPYSGDQDAYVLELQSVVTSETNARVRLKIEAVLVPAPKE